MQNIKNPAILLIISLFLIATASSAVASDTWNIVFVMTKAPSEAVHGAVLEVKVGNTSFTLPAQSGVKKLVQITHAGADDSQLKSKNNHIKNLPFSVKLKKGNTVLAERSESYLPCYALSFGSGGYIGFLASAVYTKPGPPLTTAGSEGSAAEGSTTGSYPKQGASAQEDKKSVTSSSRTQTDAASAAAASSGAYSAPSAISSSIVNISALPAPAGAKITGIWKPKVGYHWIYERAGGVKESLWQPHDWRGNRLAAAYEIPAVSEYKVLTTENINGRLCWVIQIVQSEERVILKDGSVIPNRKQTLTFRDWVDCKTNEILKCYYEEKTVHSPVPIWLKKYYAPHNSRVERFLTNINYSAGTMTQREIVYNEDLTTAKKDETKTARICPYGYPNADFTNDLQSQLAVGKNYKLFNVTGIANAATPMGLYPSYVLQSGSATIYAAKDNHFIVKYVLPYLRGQKEERELVYANFNIGQTQAGAGAIEVVSFKADKDYYVLADTGQIVQINYKLKNRGTKTDTATCKVKVFLTENPDSVTLEKSGAVITLDPSKVFEGKADFNVPASYPGGEYTAQVSLYDAGDKVIDSEWIKFKIYSRPKFSILEVKLLEDKLFQPSAVVTVICGVENSGYNGDIKIESQIEDKTGKIYAKGSAEKKDFYGRQNKEYTSKCTTYEHIKITLPKSIPMAEYRVKTIVYWIKPQGRGQDAQDDKIFSPVLVGEVLTSDIIPLRGSQKFPFKLKAVYTNTENLAAKSVTGYVNNTPFALNANGGAVRKLLEGKEYTYNFIPAQSGRNFKWGEYEYKARAQDIKEKEYTTPLKKFKIGPYEYAEEDETYIKNVYWYQESGKKDKKIDFSSGVNYKGKKYYPVCITRNGAPNGHLWVDKDDVILEDENIIKGLFAYVIVCGDGSGLQAEIDDYKTKVEEDAHAMNNMLTDAQLGKVAELSSNIIGIVCSAETLATGGAGAIAKIGNILAVIDIIAQTKSSKDILADLCDMDENSLGKSSNVETFQQIEKLQVESSVSEPFKAGYGEISLAAGVIKDAAEVIKMYNTRQSQVQSFASAFAASQSKTFINKAMLKSKMASAGVSIGAAVAAWIENPSDIAPDALYLALCYQKRCILNKKIAEIYTTAKNGILRDEEVNDLLLLPVEQALSASMAAVILTEGAGILEKRGKTISGMIAKGTLWSAKKLGITDKDYGDKIDEIKKESVSMAKILSDIYIRVYEDNNKVISYQVSNTMTRIKLAEQILGIFSKEK